MIVVVDMRVAVAIADEVELFTRCLVTGVGLLNSVGCVVVVGVVALN